MKTPSATSLPRAPRDDSDARFRKYTIMMAVRVACFVLMVVITPYGWYTWILAIGAVFLPYVAVVIANVGSAPPPAPAQSPELAIAAPTTEAPAAPRIEVFRISEVAPKSLGAGSTTGAGTPANEPHAARDGDARETGASE